MAAIEQHQHPLAPPHNLEAEQSVLGAILLADTTLYGLVINEGLKPDHFYRTEYATVYQAMLDLYGESREIDVLTVTEQLRSVGRIDEVGGPAAVDALAGAAPAAGNVREYARIVHNNALLRRLLRTTQEIQANVYGHAAPAREVVEWAERDILDVAHDDRQKDFRSVGAVLDDEIDKLHRLSVQHTSLTGTPSGFKDLDEVTGGFQPGNLIILAARPSMGKSAFVTNIAENAAIEHRKPVALFSLEMSEAELAQRFVASQARIKGEDLRKGRVAENRWPKILEASQRLADSPLYVDDSSDMSMLEVRAKARRLHQQNPGGLGMIIVDYLQLLRPDGRVESRVEQVGQMSRGLKILARELQVPVIALSQLSRAVETRTDKRPILSDLRESGQIEQDADLVMFIFREEYYDRESEREGEADIIIAKHRNGGLADIVLTFQKEYPKFMNFAGDRFG
ncbi:replicative DNA helicase [Conexibacter woesei]|uniref:Replicative DNA helicase n=1 Tax=Conexibacter woesei (strain DSM 14684 / CCUG 47730 / CIP 108061 / JCM 11494 / NBRC 100937 / ID131577) TaxID=469383 RepID=D3F3T9_CONWI|nr:replicative DNA helicase [Conexibacter woesei]ADB54314.1 replicative DNA helicase [Conexibacter woesei DSM 14684]